MKNAVLFFVFGLLLSLSALHAQNTSGDNLSAADFLDVQSASTASAAGLCPAEPCPCSGGFLEMSVYYFGENNVTIDVFTNKPLTNQIASFPGVVSGQLLTISGAGLPGGELAVHSFFRVTTGGGDVCVTPIYSRCPSNAWPGSLEDLKVIGKTYGDFTVYSHRDTGNNYTCTIDDAGVNQDWRVGGNVIGAAKNTLGTLNNESVVFITGNTPRGTITDAGNFGIGTLAPTATLDVAGNSRISQTLEVAGATTVGGNLTVEAAGVTRLLSNAASTTAANGALVVGGGAGVGENLNVGANVSAGNNITAGNDLIADNNLEVGSDAFVADRLAVGTTMMPGSHRVYVDGSILATEVKVALTANWPDYVFADGYATPDLKVWEEHIRTQKHLPGIPSAAQVAQSGGIELGEMNRLLLEKIEQLALISLQQQKELNRLMEEVQVLKGNRN
ncbi:MAG: hypothetical protein KF852_00175 [Saprospiraceae bacterium]|nr:hypothetical protein [Saprospiraceae bacterium]